MSAAARRPDYRHMTLTFAIALGKVLKSQRQWLKNSNNLTSRRSVHPLSACAEPLRFAKTCNGSGMPPFLT